MSGQGQRETMRGDAAFEARMRRLFDQDVAAVDRSTRARLAESRARALNELAAGAPRTPWSWLPAGAIAAMAAMWLLWQGPPAPEADLRSAMLGDLEILLGEEELDLLDELEFYTWLDEHPEFAVPDASGDGIG